MIKFRGEIRRIRTGAYFKVLAVIVCSAWAAFAEAGKTPIPAYINYQGELRDAKGEPLPSGIVQLSFRLFSEEVGEDSLVWGPQHKEANLVNGRFNVVLGPTDVRGISLSTAFAGGDRYLEVTLNGESVISPRQRVLSTAFAFAAGNDVPIGSIVPWCPPEPVSDLEQAKKHCPKGFRICCGPAPDTEDDMATVFNEMLIPDLTTGQFLKGGEPADAGTLQSMPKHSHVFSGLTSEPVEGNADVAWNGNWCTQGYHHRHTYSGITTEADNIPRHLSVLFIIRVN